MNLYHINKSHLSLAWKVLLINDSVKQSAQVLCWEDLPIFKHEKIALSVTWCFEAKLELMWLAGFLSDESTQAGGDKWRLHWLFSLNICSVSHLSFVFVKQWSFRPYLQYQPLTRIWMWTTIHTRLALKVSLTRTVYKC